MSQNSKGFFFKYFASFRDVILKSTTIAKLEDHDLNILVLINIIAFHQIRTVADPHYNVFVLHQPQLNLLQLYIRLFMDLTYFECLNRYMWAVVVWKAPINFAETALPNLLINCITTKLGVTNIFANLSIPFIIITVQTMVEEMHVILLHTLLYVISLSFDKIPTNKN